jgi:hypothetical protein
VPVGVVRPDADQSDRSSCLPVEERILVGGTVVRDLDHVRRVDTPGTQSPLRSCSQVAEEQPGHARRAVGTGIGPQHQARVVPGVGRGRARPQHAPPQRSERPGGGVVGRTDVDACSLQGLHGPLVGGASDRSDEGRRHAVRHGVDGTDVIAVEVGEDEQVDPVDAEQAQTRLEPFGIVTGVDERDPAPADSPTGCRPARSDEHRVPLAHVARGRRPVRRQRGAHDQPGDGDDREPDRSDHAGEQEEPEAHHPRREDRDGDARAHHSRSRHTADARRPRGRRVRQCGGTVGDAPDRTRGDPRDRGEDRAAPRPHRCDQARGESHDGDDRCERLGEEVGGHGVRRERGRQRDRHRPACELGGDRHGECGGDGRPQPAREQCGQRRPEHHDPAGREHREDEGE